MACVTKGGNPYLLFENLKFSVTDQQDTDNVETEGQEEEKDDEAEDNHEVFLSGTAKNHVNIFLDKPA